MVLLLVLLLLDSTVWPIVLFLGVLDRGSCSDGDSTWKRSDVIHVVDDNHRTLFKLVPLITIIDRPHSGES